ncbi:MAG: hypothetical protein NUW22_05110 [Acidobacteria bacterium]|nr:hypothetical protein [Acidobacteriota bacterium]
MCRQAYVKDRDRARWRRYYDRNRDTWGERRHGGPAARLPLARIAVEIEESQAGIEAQLAHLDRLRRWTRWRCA